jgi:hypothetical protein
MPVLGIVTLLAATPVKNAPCSKPFDDCGIHHVCSTRIYIGKCPRHQVTLTFPSTLDKQIAKNSIVWILAIPNTARYSLDQCDTGAKFLSCRVSALVPDRTRAVLSHPVEHPVFLKCLFDTIQSSHFPAIEWCVVATLVVGRCIITFLKLLTKLENYTESTTST